jgi:hypothetical protein
MLPSNITALFTAPIAFCSISRAHTRAVESLTADESGSAARMRAAVESMMASNSLLFRFMMFLQKLADFGAQTCARAMQHHGNH